MSNSILLSGDEDFINIPLYYKVKKNKYGVRQFRVLEDEDGKKAIEQKEPDVEVLNTKWKPHAWQTSSFLQKNSNSYDQASGLNVFDFAKYQDNIFTNCLIEWDMVDSKNQPIPVSPKAIGSLPSVIAKALFTKYETSNVMDEEEQKKS